MRESIVDRIDGVIIVSAEPDNSTYRTPHIRLTVASDRGWYSELGLKWQADVCFPKDFLNNVLNLLSAEGINDLEGRPIRVKWGFNIVRYIGHPVSDKWVELYKLESEK